MKNEQALELLAELVAATNKIAAAVTTIAETLDQEVRNLEATEQWYPENYRHDEEEQ